ncbi:MAG: DUF4258 domain-containing protein [Candidatus Bathyarchaeota archaeon]|nr:DUF4258 domain-containing protein [Candidatus Bathyarchaeota archaeon]
MSDASKIQFTKHALDKFKLLQSYGFEISKEQIIDTISNPERVDAIEGQFLATKKISPRHAVRVVYELRKGFLVVITFYPVRRERYDL